MAGIDNTLIAYIAQNLLNCKVAHLTQMILWLSEKKGEHFAYGRDFYIRWPMTDAWIYDVNAAGDPYQKEAMAACQARADMQPMPDKRFEGKFTFESHLYEVMMQAAEATGLEERQVIQRILHGCAEYHLCESLIAKLRKFTTLDALLRHMITTARDAAAPSGVRIHTQRYLRQFAPSEKMPEGYFKQTVYLEDNTAILSIHEGVKGTLRQYMLTADLKQLMENTRCIFLQGGGWKRKINLPARLAYRSPAGPA